MLRLLYQILNRNTIKSIYYSLIISVSIEMYLINYQNAAILALILLSQTEIIYLLSTWTQKGGK